MKLDSVLVTVGDCFLCSQVGLCFDGVCGECSDASGIDAYLTWWHSVEGEAERLAMAERVLSLLALEDGDRLSSAR
jgi:hypothetical protein